MKRTKQFLQRWGLHAFLLPIFFCLHNYKQYFGLVSVATAVRLLFTLLAITFAFFLLLNLFIRRSTTILLLTTLFGFFILFFGDIKDFFEQTISIHYIPKYSILLPLIGVATVFLSIRIWRLRRYYNTNLFLNLLLIIFILIDVMSFFAFNSSTFLQNNLLVVKSISQSSSIKNRIGTPDVYYLVFDCYPGTSYLKDFMRFDNSSMDSALQNFGFHVVSNSNSNYNRTAFSIASTLNYEYLKNIDNNYKVTSNDYNRALLTIKNSAVVRFFKELKYQVYNLSIFNLDDIAPIYRENFLSMPEESMLLYNTLFERIKTDLLWNFYTGKFQHLLPTFFTASQKLTTVNQLKKRNYNNLVADSLLKLPLINTTRRKFIYAHFYLPHPPYFYTESGKQNDTNVVVSQSTFRDSSLFLSYLKYTNDVIKKICNNIIQNSKEKSVIIIESDHGFTDFNGGPDEPKLQFKNYQAFYFPDQDYTSIYDSLSNINTFPIIFNKYFNTQIPMQKDSSVFLRN